MINPRSAPSNCAAAAGAGWGGTMAWVTVSAQAMGSPKYSKRALRLPPEAQRQRQQNDEADLEEDGQSNQEGRRQHRPYCPILAELGQQRFGQRAAAARMFDVAAHDGAERHHHGDEAERFAEARLNGLEQFPGFHAAGEPQADAGEQQRQKRVHPRIQDEKQQKADGGQRVQNQEISARHECP